MADKLYRTASGKRIDMQKLMLQNEDVRAVGNMNVNARGDVLDSNNKTIARRNEQVNKTYRKQIGNVAQDLPVYSSKKAAQVVAEEYRERSADVEIPAEEVLASLEQPVKVETKPAKTVEKKKEAVPVTGLAGAIAKAREVKQEALPSERKTDGVKKI